MDGFLGQVDFPTLSEDVKSRLDEPIIVNEITRAISSMQTGRSPGPDSLPNSIGHSQQHLLLFWPLFWKSPSKLVAFNIQSSPYNPNSKKGKDPEDCASYRPISLLNADVKILAKVLARRLEDTLPSIIDTDQTGFVKNHHSFFNVRRLLNILHSPNNSVPECVVSLDAEKAFDRVEWKYQSIYSFGKLDSGQTLSLG